MQDGIETRVVPVVGVTFDNDDGSNRQDIIEELDNLYGEDIDLVDVRLDQYLYQGDPAYHVILDGKIVGNLKKELAKEIHHIETEKNYYVWVDSARIVGGGDDDFDGDRKLKYGIRLKICIASPEAAREILDKIKAKQDAKKDAYIFCQNCGEKVFEEAIMCPKCGTKLVHNNLSNLNIRQSRKASSDKRKRTKGTYKLVIAGIFILYGLRFFASNTILMVILMLMALPFILWWVATDMNVDRRR